MSHFQNNLSTLRWIVCLFFSMLLCKCFAVPTNSDSNANNSNTQVEYVEEDTVIYPLWIGPGYYYGIWFENENDYNHWQSENHNRSDHRQNRDQYDRGYHQNEHHEGEYHGEGEGPHGGGRAGGGRR